MSVFEERRPATRAGRRTPPGQAAPEAAAAPALPTAPEDRGGLAKSRTGIDGLDEVTGGGLPQGRPTLVCGAAGCGKTLLALQFLVHGALRFGEPGVFLAFEETAEELAANVRSLGVDLDDLIRRRLLVVDYVHLERAEIEEAGEYDLEGLFLRLGHAIDSLGARRVALDTVENLFGGLRNEAVLRAELRRLFRWLKERQVTAIVTAERGENALTRQGLEEYVSDCVILLDHRVIGQVATRRLRIVKYRGSAHGTNEFPFLIDESGIEVLPISAAGLAYRVSSERISSGIPQLDEMLGGGYYRGSSILVSGTAGSGKSTIAAHFVAAASQRGERSVYFAFEESQDQVVRNMASVGIDLEPWLRQGILTFRAARPSLYGLEAHLAAMHRTVREAQPRVVVMDPIGSFLSVGEAADVKALLVRLLDFLKTHEITGLFTNLMSPGEGSLEHTAVGISSLMDTWLLLRDLEQGGERNRGLYVLKSRGMAHSKQVREFLLTDHGVELMDVYLGGDGVLVGSARRAQQARERLDAETGEQEIERQRRQLALKRQAMEAEVARLRADFDFERAQVERLLDDTAAGRARSDRDRDEIARSRQEDGGALPGPRSPR